MAWTASGIFSAFKRDALTDVAAFNLDLETHKVALYSNAITPDFAATSALSAYNAATSQWVVANEVSGTGWAAGGVALTSTTATVATNVFTFDAADVSQASTTLTNAYGCLIYADALATPVAKQGIVAVWFGGTAYSTNNGTFAITWAAAGLMTWT